MYKHTHSLTHIPTHIGVDCDNLIRMTLALPGKEKVSLHCMKCLLQL